MEKQKIVVVVGPTASGKSDLAVALAKEFNGEVISADSRQVYRGFDVTTAKITPDEMGGVPHHLLNIAEIEQEYTAANFKIDGEKCIDEITQRGHVPIIAGGTGFYIDTLVYGFTFPEVPPNNPLREELEAKSAEELFALLKAKDPARASTIESMNPRRLIRALEIVEAIGIVPPLEKSDTQPYNPLWIGIEWNREDLRERIQTRIVKRIDVLIDEIEKEKGRLTSDIAMRLGFDFTLTLSYLAHEISKAGLKEKLIQKDVALARRQITWWKRNKCIHWLKAANHKEEAIDLVKYFLL